MVVVALHDGVDGVLQCMCGFFILKLKK